MENVGGTKRRLPVVEMVMCSTCSGFVLRFERKPSPDEVVEVVVEPEKMRDMLRAVLLHGPLQKMEPAEANREQRHFLRMRRRILMETKRCPACSGSPLEPCPTRFRWLLEKKPSPDEDDKAMLVVADPRSKSGSKSSMEEVSEFMALLRSEGEMEIATEDGMMVPDPRSKAGSKSSREEISEFMAYLQSRKEARSSEHKLKRSREEGKISSSGSKANGDDKEGSRSSKKKAKRSNEVEGSGSKEAEMDGSESIDEVLIEGIAESVSGGLKTKMQIKRALKKAIEILSNSPVKIKENIELAGGNWKTKMVTQRLDKKTVDLLLKNRPRPDPTPYDKYLTNPIAIDALIAMDKVDRLFHRYLQYQSIIKGYAEYQLEVIDDGGDDVRTWVTQ